MDYGGETKLATYEVAKSLGKRTPLDTMPELSFFGEWYVEHYLYLSNSRNFNGRIPASEIALYHNAFGLFEDLGTFFKTITTVDQKLITIEEKKSGRDTDKRSGDTPKRKASKGASTQGIKRH